MSLRIHGSFLGIIRIRSCCIHQVCASPKLFPKVPVSSYTPAVPKILMILSSLFGIIKFVNFLVLATIKYPTVKLISVSLIIKQRDYFHVLTDIFIFCEMLFSSPFYFSVMLLVFSNWYIGAID